MGTHCLASIVRIPEFDFRFRFCEMCNLNPHCHGSAIYAAASVVAAQTAGFAIARECQAAPRTVGASLPRTLG